MIRLARQARATHHKFLLVRDTPLVGQPTCIRIFWNVDGAEVNMRDSIQQRRQAFSSERGALGHIQLLAQFRHCWTARYVGRLRHDSVFAIKKVAVCPGSTLAGAILSSEFCSKSATGASFRRFGVVWDVIICRFRASVQSKPFQPVRRSSKHHGYLPTR